MVLWSPSRFLDRPSTDLLALKRVSRRFRMCSVEKDRAGAALYSRPGNSLTARPVSRGTPSPRYGTRCNGGELVVSPATAGIHEGGASRT